jgi:hypothetical protein
MPKTKRKQPKAVKNGAQSNPKAAPRPVVSEALKLAILTMDDMQLRSYLIHYCEMIEPLNEALEKKWLVPGKEVVRYHVDSDSEDDQDSENESSEDDEDEEDEDGGERRRKAKPIAVADDEMTPRFAKCMNCEVEFDVTSNDRGDCIWHSGIKPNS